MDYSQAINELKNDKLAGGVFIYGDEDYLAESLIDFIIKKYLDEGTIMLNYDKIEMDSPDFSKLEAATETLPFMAEKRIVQVNGLDLSREGISKHKKFYESLQAYLAKLSRDVILIIKSKSGKFFKGALYKAGEKHGAVVEVSVLNKKEIGSFIVRKLGRSGVQISRPVLAQLIDAIGYGKKEYDVSLYDVDNELEKLISVAKGSVSSQDLAMVYNEDKHTVIFALTDALYASDMATAMDKYLTLRKHEEDGRIFHMIIRQYRNLLNLKVLMGQARDDYQIKQIIGIKDYEYKKLRGIQGRYRIDELKEIYRALYQVEVNHKSSRGDLAINMVRLISKICSI